jgi:hypothetical protein
MKIEHINTYGWDDAIRGMRNPLNSWNRSDSTFKFNPDNGRIEDLNIGPNDEKLIKALTYGGSPHRKFLRSIIVSMDITAPTYWWSEMDTYKICTTRNSCSLQHKGDSREFTENDFTFENQDTLSTFDYAEILNDKETIINIINKWRNKYVEDGKTDYNLFRVMRQFIPMSYNYKSTWTANYEVLLNIYQWRKTHKLKEWRDFCEFTLNNCPYFKTLVEFSSNKKTSIDK